MGPVMRTESLSERFRARSLPSCFLFIHLLRRENLFLGCLECLALTFDGAEEAGVVTLMTGGAILLDLDEERVAVAVEGDVFDGLGVAAFLAFHPVFLAGAAPKMGLASLDGVGERGAVHPRHHHDASGFLFLNDGGDQAVGVKFQFVVEAHSRII